MVILAPNDPPLKTLGNLVIGENFIGEQENKITLGLLVGDEYVVFTFVECTNKSGDVRLRSSLPRNRYGR